MKGHREGQFLRNSVDYEDRNFVYYFLYIVQNIECFHDGAIRKLKFIDILNQSSAV